MSYDLYDSNGYLEEGYDQTSMVDVQICFYLLDGLPGVGLFRKDSEGYGYCDNFMVAEPDGHPILNIDEYRMVTVSVPIKTDGSYDRPEIMVVPEVLRKCGLARRRVRSQCVDCMVSPSRDMSR